MGSPLPGSSPLDNALRALSACCAGLGTAACIILCGYPKSGNTLIRFAYHNLINVVNHGAKKTLTYRQLNRVNPNGGFPDGLAGHGFTPPEGIDHRGFPLMLHGHAPWQPWWRTLGPMLYVYRHPLDCLIGLWHATEAFPVGIAQPAPIDAFVSSRLPAWIAFHRSNLAAADHVLRYDDMMRDDLAAFRAAWAAVGVAAEPADHERAVAMSRFDAIRAMEEESGEYSAHRADAERRARFGLAAWKSGPDVRFTRSGAIGQWRTALQRQTLETATTLLDAAGLREDPVVAPLFQAQQAGWS